MSQAEVMQYVKKPTQTIPVFLWPTLEPSPKTTKWQAEEPYASLQYKVQAATHLSYQEMKKLFTYKKFIKAFLPQMHNRKLYQDFQKLN